MDKIFEAYIYSLNEVVVRKDYADNIFWVSAPNGSMIKINLVYKNGKYEAIISVDDKVLKTYKNVPINFDISHKNQQDLLLKNLQSGIADKWMKTVFKMPRLRS